MAKRKKPRPSRSRPSKKKGPKPAQRAPKGARWAARPRKRKKPAGPPKPVVPVVKKKKHAWVVTTRQAKIPRGYEPPRDTLREARDRIVRYLQSFADCVQGHGARAKVVVYTNPNDTIDAQVTVDKIPRGYPVFHPSKPDVITDGENCFHEAIKGERDIVKNDYFIRGVLDIVDKRGRDTADRRYRGMNEYGTFWYRAVNVFDMFEALRARGEYTQKKRGKPKRIRLQMHWNVLNLPPGGLVREKEELKKIQKKLEEHRKKMEEHKRKIEERERKSQKKG